MVLKTIIWLTTKNHEKICEKIYGFKKPWKTMRKKYAVFKWFWKP
jgi:hypothetical protein